MNRRRFLLASAAVLATNSIAHAAGSKPVQIAAAADLKFALEEIVTQFKSQTGLAVEATFGSSGNFAKQLQQGAPFDLFMSADESFVFGLADADKTMDRGELYAVGRIVLFAPNGSPLQADGKFDDLRAALKDGRVQKFAIANPEHAPYGRAAREALQKQSLWADIESKLVLGENVAQAAQFATSGSAQGGIFAYSLALSPNVAKLGSFALVPAEWHEPLRQRMVLLKNASPEAQALYQFIRAKEARVIFRKYGFALPGETS
jgi:molybdate transport system substrate-binding protein